MVGVRSKWWRYCICSVAFMACATPEEKGDPNGDATAPRDTVLDLDQWIEEVFVDSTHIGSPGNNKVEVAQYRSPDSVFVRLVWHEKKDGHWIKRNEHHVLKDGLTGIEGVVTDLDHDGLGDLTFRCGIAARGANEHRRIWVYDEDRKDLVPIGAWQNYPNIRYNKRLDCLDAFLVYGGCSTIFLKISGDSLKKIASVDLFEGLTITTFDDQDRGTVIREDPNYEGGYIRFVDFDPLEVAEEY